MSLPSGPPGTGTAPNEGLVPVIEIGGTHVTAALADLEAGTIRAGSVRREQLSPSGAAAEILSAVVRCGQGIPAMAGQRWGVAIPGPFDYENGIGLFTNVGKFESLRGVDVKAVLMAQLPGPPGAVSFLNDADAFLWGEWLFGAAAGCEPCVGVTLGTGIGSAFLADGRVHQSGPGVPPEGRADLLRIAGQPLEEVVSTRAIERTYRLRSGSTPRGAAEVAALARAGDQVAGDVLRAAFVQLGAALSPWLREFRARMLVIGGSMTGSWDIIGPALVQGILAGEGAALSQLQVRVAEQPEHAAMLGAAAHALGHDRYRPGPVGPEHHPGLGLGAGTAPAM